MSSNDPLEIALRELESLEQLGIAALVAATSPEAVEAARIEYLGQKQVSSRQPRSGSTLDPAGKRVYGQRFNAVKQSPRGRPRAPPDRGWNVAPWPPARSMSRFREPSPAWAIAIR